MLQTETNEQTDWQTACSFDDVPAGGVRAVRLGARVVALVRDANDQLFAVDNTCPHRGGPLAGGKLLNGELACPWHGFRFDPATGCARMPTQHSPAQTIPARRAGNDVQLLLPTQL